MAADSASGAAGWVWARTAPGSVKRTREKMGAAIKFETRMVPSASNLQASRSGICGAIIRHFMFDWGIFDARV
jgi:hypothetical protein